MTNEQQVVYLTGLKFQLLKALDAGQCQLADEYPETIGFFGAVKTKGFKPFKEIIKELDREIAILSPSFP